MTNDKFDKRKYRRVAWFFILACPLLFLRFAAPLEARLLESEQLIKKVVEANRDIRQFRILTTATVYDPRASAPLSEDLKEKLLPYEQPKRAFKQDIIWIRDEYLSIETQDNSGNSLHIYIEQGPKTLSKNLDLDREFHDEDIVFPPVFFYTKHDAWIRYNISRLGIQITPPVFRERTFRLLFQVGTADGNLLIDPDLYRVEEINRNVQIQGREYQYKVLFGDWRKDYKTIPMRIQFFIQNRLFKDLRITKYQRGRLGAYRRKTLKTYRRYFPKNNRFILEMNYGS